MKTKKILSLLLALAMIFSLSVSVWASSGNSTTPTNEWTGTATVTIPTIAVSVPTAAGKLFINPMGFKVKVNDGKAAGASDTTGITDNKIVSPVVVITNSSPMNLAVSVNGILTPASTNTALSITTSPIVEGDTKNNVFIYAVFGTPSGSEGAETLGDQEYAPDTEGILVLGTKESGVTKVGTVAAANSTTPTKFAFKFLGDCAENPKNDWSASDKVDVKLAFSFKPVTGSTSSEEGSSSTDTGEGEGG